MRVVVIRRRLRRVVQVRHRRSVPLVVRPAEGRVIVVFVIMMRRVDVRRVPRIVLGPRLVGSVDANIIGRVVVGHGGCVG